MSHKLTSSREIAYDIFTRVMKEKVDPNELLDQAFQEAKPPLARIDRNFAKEVLFGGLRWYYKIFWILQKVSKRDLDSVQDDIKTALILGSYQIFYMDRVPDRAAVNESVEYVRKKGNPAAVNFVNGILRSISRRAEYFAKPDKDKQPIEYLALQFSHPKWIVEKWSRSFNFHKVKDLLAANNQLPPYTVRVNQIKVKKEEIPELRNLLLRDEKTKSDRCHLRSCLQLESAPATNEGSLFAKGYFTIQDQASQLIPLLLDVRQEERIIDACCGPGGKTSQIYELSQGTAKITAIEKSAKQLEKARRTFERLGHPQPEWVEQDFLSYIPAEAPDKILLDAPCSGLGVLRRHPDGKWLKTPSITNKMAVIQKDLLAQAFKILKVGGELVYSVCSFEPEETYQQLEWIRNAFADRIEVVSPIRRLPDYFKRFVTKENILLIYSGNKESMDGFGSFIIKKLK